MYVHFQSDVAALDAVECWGVLGDRSSWMPVPGLFSWYSSIDWSREAPALKDVMAASAGGGAPRGLSDAAPGAAQPGQEGAAQVPCDCCTNEPADTSCTTTSNSSNGGLAEPLALTTAPAAARSNYAQNGSVAEAPAAAARAVVVSATSSSGSRRSA